jgi:hypothetical protein
VCQQKDTERAESEKFLEKADRGSKRVPSTLKINNFEPKELGPARLCVNRVKPPYCPPAAETTK